MVNGTAAVGLLKPYKVAFDELDQDSSRMDNDCRETDRDGQRIPLRDLAILRCLDANYQMTTFLILKENQHRIQLPSIWFSSDDQTISTSLC